MLHVLWTQKLIIIAALVVVTAAAYYYQGHQIPVYQSTAGLTLSSDLTASSEQSAAAPVDFSPRAALRGPVLASAEQKAGLPAGSLSGSTTASIDSTTGDLSIVVSAEDPNTAKVAANAVADAFIASLQKTVDTYQDGLRVQLTSLGKTIQQLQSRIPVPTKAVPNPRTDALLQAQIDSAVSRYTDISGQIDRISGIGDPAIVTSPPVAGSLTTPSSAIILGVGALAGLVAGVGLALIWYFANPRIRGADDIEAVPSVPVLAIVPAYRDKTGTRDNSLAIVEQPNSPFTEAIRALRTDVAARLPETGASVVVASPGAGEGRSFLTANLAASFALSGRRTALVFGDVRNNVLDRYFSPTESPDGNSEPEEAGQAAEMKRQPARPDGVELEESSVDNLYLVRTLVSTEPAADALAQESTRKALIDIAGKAEIVIIDTPALSEFADAAVLGGYTSGVIIIAQRNRTRPAALHSAIERLRTAGAKPLGVVLNSRR